MIGVWIDSKPWQPYVELRIAVRMGRVTQAATGVTEAGEIVWTAQDEMAEIPPLLVLSRDVLEELAKELGNYVPATDVTTEALRDARTVRDRLLSLVEARWPYS
jgi:hypothetical protein